MNVPIKYLPKRLSKKDKAKQKKQLQKSRAAYKKGIYINRKPLTSFKNKKSQHLINAEKIYKVNKIVINNNLAKKTGCSIKALNKIVKKGIGAFYSSGSRPSQTSYSWGIARLASSISGGKAAAIDYNILQEGCLKNSKALKLAKKSRIKNGYGTRKVPKTKL
jgi:hypothetical protein|tara:strand:- start:204 stop:692 length:489 start_codon:yes stop_codon:yes gene_type:complete